MREAIEAGECIVYERDAHVLGYAVLRRGHFYRRDFIDLVFVAPEAHRQRIGRSLMRASLRAATTPSVFTSANKSNSAKQALRHSEGWSRSNEPVRLDEGDVELVYYRAR